MSRTRKFVIAYPILLIGLLLMTFGCSRGPVLEFSQHKGIADLPERHQKNISDGLFRLYGTPVNPRLRMVEELDEEAEDVEDDSEDAEEESEEPKLPPLIDVASPSPGELEHGAIVYNARCAGCHGLTGDGNGPAGQHLRPRPRDYRRGIFKFTSTPYGLKPARHDLVRTIRRGAKGTSMPAFPWMSDVDLNAVVDYVIYLSKRGEVEGEVVFMADEYFEDEDVDFQEFVDAIDSTTSSWEEAESEVVSPVTAEPPYEEESVVAGRKLFLSQGCSKCHGVDGKGQVEWLNPEFLAAQEKLPEDQRVQINKDAWEEPAPAADLTARMLHGGRRPIDIYRRIYTGINGTPMPAFADIFADDPDGIWHLVHYVQHIIEGKDPIAGIETLPVESSDDVDTEEVDASEENSDAAPDTATEPDTEDAA